MGKKPELEKVEPVKEQEYTKREAWKIIAKGQVKPIAIIAAISLVGGYIAYLVKGWSCLEGLHELKLKVFGVGSIIVYCAGRRLKDRITFGDAELDQETRNTKKTRT